MRPEQRPGAAEPSWSILDGQYDPAINPALSHDLEAIEIREQLADPYSPKGVIERIALVETALYALRLCNPEAFVDEGVVIDAQRKLGRGAILLYGHGFSSLQSRLKTEIQRLQISAVPAYEVIDDMLAQNMINSYRADELRVIIDAAVIAEKKGNLPAPVKSR